MSNVNVHGRRAEQQAPSSSIAERPHGTRARYLKDKCRCAPCREANAAYMRGRRSARRRGEVALVPAVRARRHLEQLLEGGLSVRKVATASGVARSTLQGVAAGEQQRITPDVERRLLTVELLDVHEHPARRAEDILESYQQLALALGELDQRWIERAACRTTSVPPEAFHSSNHAQQGRALIVCASCTVRSQCLEMALVSGDPGIWGGTKPAERRQLQLVREAARGAA